MSNDNCKFPADCTALDSEKSSAIATMATGGLFSIVLALELQKKEHRQKSITTTNTTPPNTTSTAFHPIPHAVNKPSRVVSTDIFGENDCVGEFTPPQLPPQVKEEGKKSCSAKASENTLCSPPLESAERPAAPSSPSPYPPLSEAAANDSLISTDETSKAADFSQVLADPEGWLLQTENLFAKLPTVDRNIDNIVAVQPNDVLCGRGGETNHHPGNIRYRSLVKAYQKLYLLAKRRDKPKIAQCIVVSVRGVNGRFLKRTKNVNKGSAWVDVGNVKAREKTSQALREGAPNLRDNVNPPVTTSATNDNTVASGRQVLVSDQTESMSAPPTTTSTLPTNKPTALETLMGWTSPSLSPSDADTDALAAQLFTKKAAQLMQHPAFHQLDQARQQEAILFELKSAKAAVESAKRTSTSTGTTKSAKIHEQGRTSPMVPTSSMKQEQPPQSQLHHQTYRTHEYPYFQPRHYYPHLASKIAPPQNAKSVDLDIMYRELLAAKAAATTTSSSNLVSENTKNKESIPENTTSGHQRNMKKRPMDSAAMKKQLAHPMDPAALSTCSHPARSPAVVSDAGSEISSSSSCASSITSGGSRLKRLKLRMKSDFN
jgi:hypothetical protein